MNAVNVLLRPSIRRDRGLEAVRRVADKLLELDLVPLMEEEYRSGVSLEGVLFGELEELLARCDLVMPVGGDGTVMHAAKHAARSGKPVLGVNAGRVGFLTQLELDEVDRLSLLAEGRYTLSQRMMLEGRLEDQPRVSFHALNDVVITRSDPECMVDITVTQGEHRVRRFRADGVIFATPTGSTAYSLSAGGPILTPDLSAIVLTAICPNATLRSSLVLPPEGRYEVREDPWAEPVGLVVAVDGRRVGAISPGKSASVEMSHIRARFVDLGLRDFYTNLDEKLSWR